MSTRVPMPASVTALQPSKLRLDVHCTMPAIPAEHTRVQGFCDILTCCYTQASCGFYTIILMLCLASAAAGIVEAAFAPSPSLADNCCVPLAGPASRGGSQHSARAKQSPYGVLRARGRRGLHRE